MARTVTDNYSVAHIYAQQNQESARSHNGNFYFEGPAVYSYRTCIGMFLKPHGSKASDSPTLFLSDTNHSVSTSRVQSYLRSACRHHDIVYVSSDLLNTISFRPWFFKNHGKGATTSEKKLNRAHCKVAIQKQADEWSEAARRELRVASRARSRKEGLVNRAQGLVNRARKLAKLFKVRISIPKDLRLMDSDMESLLAGVATEMKARKARELKARKEREAAQRERDAGLFAEWQRGISRYACPPSYETSPNGGVYMRRYYKPDGTVELQTSQGARVPWAHALRVFKALKAIRASGQAWEANGRVLRVGHFSVDRIEPNGDFKAGCHVFKWADIEPFAIAQGVYGIEADDSAIVEKESV